MPGVGAARGPAIASGHRLEVATATLLRDMRLAYADVIVASWFFHPMPFDDRNEYDLLGHFLQ